MNRRKLAVLLALMLMVGIVAVTRYGMSTPARRNLPWSATDVREHYIDMFVDHAYFLRARIDKDDFPNYLKRLGLVADGSAGMSLDSANENLPPWWTPIIERGNVYSREDGDNCIAATHDGEFLYVKAWSQ